MREEHGRPRIEYKKKTARLNQQHIQLGLRKGMTVLVYHRVQSGVRVNELFQAVVIAQESVANRGKRTENKLETGCPIRG